MDGGLQAARAGLAGERAWLVGGVLRDRALGRHTADIDVVIDGDPARAARAVARAAGGAACFELSSRFGAWRVVARDSSWQVDLEPLRGGSPEADLRMRDFTVNAIAEPLAGGEPIDPLGGIGDLRAGRLRVAARSAFSDDPLRVLRLVRFAVELGLEPDEPALERARAAAPALGDCSPERVFAELRRIIAAAQVGDGLALMGRLGALAIVLPELEAIRGVAQNRFHHTDVYGHTLEVLEHTVALTRAGGDEGAEVLAALGEHRAQVTAVLAEPLANEMTRGEALRWGALLHDAAKPLTRAVNPADGRVTFIGHDRGGAALARAVLARLRTSERLQAHVAALVLNHLRAGFLVHQTPLSRNAVFGYLQACTPVEVDVTLLSIADRLATRGDRAQESIAAHLRVTRELLADALRWRSQGSPRPLLRGDELASELGIATGPAIGELLLALAEAQYAGDVGTREQAIAFARRRAGAEPGRSH